MPLSTDPTPIAAALPAPARRPRGRPRIFDEQRRQTLCSMISVGFSRREACRQAGVPPSSVVHAARTDPAFAQQLRQALIDRANRPPELADVGSRSWRAYARRLEARSHHFRLPSFPRQPLTERRLKRIVRRMVERTLEKYLLRHDCPDNEQSSGVGNSVSADSGFSPTVDYCSKTPHDFRARAEQKQ